MADNIAVMTESDDEESLMAEFDMAIQSEAFGFNHTLSIEGSICEYQNKYHNDEENKGKVKMDFNSHFSDDSAHNSDTKFEHMKKFTHCMYDNKLLIKYGIIYYTTDGCS